MEARSEWRPRPAISRLVRVTALSVPVAAVAAGVVTGPPCPCRPASARRCGGRGRRGRHDRAVWSTRVACATRCPSPGCTGSPWSSPTVHRSRLRVRVPQRQHLPPAAPGPTERRPAPEPGRRGRRPGRAGHRAFDPRPADPGALGTGAGPDPPGRRAAPAGGPGGRAARVGRVPRRHRQAHRPAANLNKAGRPDDAEWSVLARHPDEGAHLAAPLTPWLGDWLRGVRDHHERWDGTGYPDGIAGPDISLAGRIVCVTDAFETMTAVRSYKRPMKRGVGPPGAGRVLRNPLRSAHRARGSSTSRSAACGGSSGRCRGSRSSPCWAGSPAPRGDQRGAPLGTGRGWAAHRGDRAGDRGRVGVARGRVVRAPIRPPRPARP